MTTKKSAALKYLENISGGPLTLESLLESIRKGEEMSQIEFAASLKISKSHLCDIEKGRKYVTPERAARFAKLLGYSAELFVRLSLQEQIDKAGLKYHVKLEAA